MSAPEKARGVGPWEGRRLHFVGVGGAGMSGYARAAHALGAEVSGSDAAGGPYLDRLAADGVLRARIGHAAANVPAGEDVEVIYSSAVQAANAERVAARERGLAERPRAELLAELTALRRTIAVAGTHGKTTTASMLVHALRASGLEPSWLVGGAVGGRSGERRVAGRRVAGGRGGRVRSLDAQPERRDRGAHERRARPPHGIRFARGAEAGISRVPHRTALGGHLGQARAARAAGRSRRRLRRGGARPDRRRLMLSLAG